MKKINILKCGDQHGWAYHFLTQEQAKYSRHNIKYVKHDEVMSHIDWADIVYIHSPDITNWHAIDLPVIAHKKNKKVITQYSGNPLFWSKQEKSVYSYTDLVVTISPQLYSFAKNHYYKTPIIYLPESVDSCFFTPNKDKPINNQFIVGWAGGIHKKIKRGYLLEQLDFTVKIQDTWNHNRYNVDRGNMVDLKHMSKFYKSIDCLIVTSLSECMPRVVMEAMSCGLPVIGTDVGSMRLLLDNKFIVPANPEKKIVKEINNLLYILKEDKIYRTVIGNINRMKAHHFFSWQSNTKLWDEIFSMVYSGYLKNTISISEKWLNKFKREFDSTIEDTKSEIEELTDMEIKDIIIYLNNNKVDYYLLETSCLDCIRYQQLQIEPDKLYLGGDLKNLENLLIKCGFVKKENEYTRKNIIIFLKKTKFEKTKNMPFYNLRIKVPYPVVLYLIKKYGKNWKTLQFLEK